MPDRETLRKLYREDRIGVVNIGKRYGVEKQIVNSWLNYYRIPRFTKSTSASLRMTRAMKLFGRDWEPTREHFILLDTPTLKSLEEAGRISRIW
jgi:hypothetical protein